MTTRQEDQWHVDHSQRPAPRQGDEFTSARAIISAGRLVMPKGAPRPEFPTDADIPTRRRVIADWLAEHDVSVPEFIPARFGWLDCYTGQLANPAGEPGANGRTHS